MFVCFEFNYQIFFFTTVIVIEIYIGFIYVEGLATVYWIEVEVVVLLKSSQNKKDLKHVTAVLFLVTFNQIPAAKNTEDGAAVMSFRSVFSVHASHVNTGCGVFKRGIKN